MKSTTTRRRTPSRMTVWGVVALAGIMTGTLSACSSDSPETTPTTSAAGDTDPTTAPADDETTAPTVVDGQSSNPGGDGREKVIMDVDMGQLNDDAVAMFMLTQSSDTVDLLGMTTVAGNTWLEEGTAYTLRQLQLVGRPDIPVVMGAEEPLMGDRQPTMAAEEALFGASEYLGSWGRDRPESYTALAEEPYGGYSDLVPSDKHAAEFIAEQVRANPDEVTLFVLGPATNVALAVRMYPDIVPLVKEVIYMGGAVDIPGNTTPAAEFNWWYDPESVKISLRTPFKKQTIIPNDVAEAVYYTKAEYDRIVAGADTPITQMFKDRQGKRWEENPDGQSFVWDAMTTAIFLDRSIATDVQERYIDIDTTVGPDYGRSIGYHESRRRDMASGEGFPVGTQKVDIVFDIDRDKFWTMYVDLMGAPLPQ